MINKYFPKTERIVVAQSYAGNWGYSVWISLSTLFLTFPKVVWFKVLAPFVASIFGLVVYVWLAFYYGFAGRILVLTDEQMQEAREELVKAIKALEKVAQDASRQ